MLTSFVFRNSTCILRHISYHRYNNLLTSLPLQPRHHHMVNIVAYVDIYIAIYVYRGHKNGDCNPLEVLFIKSTIETKQCYILRFTIIYCFSPCYILANNIPKEINLEVEKRICISNKPLITCSICSNSDCECNSW